MRWSDACREPFRVLFPMGAFFGLIGVGHWLAYAAGWLTSYSGFYHASMQVGVYMFCFIAGFLMTALPRFSSTTPASGGELAVTLLLLAAQVVSVSAGWWIAAEGCFAGLLVLLMLFAGRRFAGRRSQVGPPTEFVWIPIGLLHGLLGSSLLMLGQAGHLPASVLAVARPMMQQGFLLSVVLGVGGFMAPRLMGREVPGVVPGSDAAGRVRRARLRRVVVHVVAGALLLMSFQMEGKGVIAQAYLLRAVIVTAELAWTTRFYRRPLVPDLYVTCVWVSLWMIVVGFWGVVLAPLYRVAMLHIVFLGGFSLMTFAVATMVVLSHGGEAERLRRPLWVLWLIAVGVAVALVLRVAADFLTDRFFQLLGVAAAAWMAAGVGWLIFLLPKVWRPSVPGAFERVHEEVKRQLLKSGSHDAC